MIAVVLALALQQDATVLDAPVYRNAAFGIELPRPFADWVFAPATERGTTTVIFKPHDAALADQLWGVLVFTTWGRSLRIGDVADRRIATTWRATLGGSFALLARDSLSVAGFPAIHAVMTGAIEHAVLDVEEYLIARDTDLVILQFRYPRGQPRDSIAAGYARALRGLRLGVATTGTTADAGAARGATPPGPTSWTATIDRGQLVFDVPEDLRAVGPGWLTAEFVANGRRVTRFSPAIGPSDTSLYAVGRFRSESRRVGRLTVRIWRSEFAEPSVTRATDTLVAIAAQAWGRYWRAFGPVPTVELALVETSWPRTVGGPAIVFLGSDASNLFVVRRELARTWWGGMVPETAGDSLVGVVLPQWSAAVVAGAVESRPEVASSVRAVELARRSAGEARFREALRTFVLESRSGLPATADFLRVLGDTAALPIRATLR